MPRIAIERAEEVEVLDESSSERFDRIAFAERAIALVRPPNTTVAICEGTHGVHVDAGRQWGAVSSARWAIVRVPPDASRRAIAAAVLGLHRGQDLGDGGPYRAHRAWALDVLMVELGGAASSRMLRRTWGDAE
jgi:hypothetical protein